MQEGFGECVRLNQMWLQQQQCRGFVSQAGKLLLLVLRRLGRRCAGHTFGSVSEENDQLLPQSAAVLMGLNHKSYLKIIITQQLCNQLLDTLVANNVQLTTILFGVD